MNPYITHPLLIPSPKFKNPTTPPLDFLPISNPQISGPDDLMITNRPYLLMRTWTPKLGSRRLIDFSTPSNTTAVNFLLWYPRLQDAFPSKSGLPHRWPTAGADTPINSCEGRPDTAKIKSGFTLHLKLGARLLYILQLPTFLPLLSFLWPPTSFPSNFSFPHPLH